MVDQDTQVSEPHTLLSTGKETTHMFLRKHFLPSAYAFVTHPYMNIREAKRVVHDYADKVKLGN